MKLTQKQLKWIAKEREILRRVIASKEASEAYKGLGADITKLQVIDLFLKLHKEETDETQSKSSGESPAVSCM